MVRQFNITQFYKRDVTFLPQKYERAGDLQKKAAYSPDK